MNTLVVQMGVSCLRMVTRVFAHHSCFDKTLYICVVCADSWGMFGMSVLVDGRATTPPHLQAADGNKSSGGTPEMNHERVKTVFTDGYSQTSLSRVNGFLGMYP